MPLIFKKLSQRWWLAAVILFVIVGSSDVLATGYVALDGTSMDIENTQDETLNPRGVRLRLGMPVAHLLDVELHVGGGRDSDTPIVDRFTASYLGAFLKAYLPVGRRSALFGLAGYSSVEFRQSINDRDFSDERSGFSYGFGLETQVTERMDLSADYVRYVRDDGLYSEVSAVSLGLKFYF